MQTATDSTLRFIRAEQAEVQGRSLDGMKVLDEGADTTLGRVEGFVIDAATPRVLFLVLDASGWFRSRHLLLPIGHARLASDSLQVDVAHDALSRYPAFDPGRIATASRDDWRAFERAIASACCPQESIADDVESYEALTHYRQPAWWVGWPISSQDAEKVRATMPSGPK